MKDEDDEMDSSSFENVDGHSDDDDESAGTKQDDGDSEDETSATAAKEEGTEGGAIPVTILSGFLGAGKTTLLRHVLQSREHKMKVAVIVNDMAELNIDGETIVRHAKREVITLQNGCICCTLRGDLIREINRIREEGGHDYVLVESTGIAEPQQVAESFCADPSTRALAESPEQMLWNVARLDTCVTVIDAYDFPAQLSTLERFKDRYSDGMEGGGDNNSGGTGDDAEGEKNIAHLLVEQVEFANVILLNKTDLVSPESLRETKGLLRAMNPKAKIIETQYGALEPELILNTRLFSMEEAQRSAGWLVSLGATGGGSSSFAVPAASEADEYGVSSFVYRVRKPFHPLRLRRWLDRNFVFANDVRGSERPLPPAAAEAAEKAEAGQCGKILRSKGFCWIAGRDSHTVGWEHAGRLFSMPPMIPWYAGTPEEEWDVEGEDDLKVIKSKFDGKHGDRRQEIVFIGIQLQKDAITTALNGCLLTDDEMLHHTYASDGKYYDPLPPWTFHYVEPCVMATILRPGQAHKFNVHDGVGLTLCNAAMKVDDVAAEDGRKPVAIRLWADFVTEDNQRTSSTLIATLRSGTCEQHSFQLLLPGTGSEDHNGPMMLRAECVSSSGRHDEADTEVYVTGHVSFLPTVERETDDDEDDEDASGDEHHHHHHHPKGRTQKRRKVGYQPIAADKE